MVIKNAKVFLEDKSFQNLDVKIDKDTIVKIDDDLNDDIVIDATDCYVVPGFVDVHTHGAIGSDFSDGDKKQIEDMSIWYAKNGVTAFLATTMTIREDEIIKSLNSIRDFKESEDSASCAGIHLEGPFIASSKKGAQAAENIKVPSVEVFNKFNQESGNKIKLITMAPEEETGLDLIKSISSYCTVSLGHTGANYNQAVDGFKCGADHVTHLFNAMPGIHHRDPAVIGAAVDNDAFAEIICDGIHIHPSAVRMAYKLFGEKLVLVSDSVRCTGMPDGEYTLGGQPIILKDRRAVLKNGTLAGSSLRMIEAVQNVVSFGIDLEDAIYSATLAPAKSVRIDNEFGVVKEGRKANIVILDKELNIKQVILRGKKI